MNIEWGKSALNGKGWGEIMRESSVALWGRGPALEG